MAVLSDEQMMSLKRVIQQYDFTDHTLELACLLFLRDYFQSQNKTLEDPQWTELRQVVFDCGFRRKTLGSKKGATYKDELVNALMKQTTVI